ncbi:hypothetical protein M8J76_013060 [Diaphorina citri]|nr:hypothetical protein M8J76_013060 [Diaphorina citri]
MCMTHTLDGFAKPQGKNFFRSATAHKHIVYDAHLRWFRQTTRNQGKNFLRSATAHKHNVYDAHLRWFRQTTKKKLLEVCNRT